MNKLDIVINNFADNLSLVGYEIVDRGLFVDDLLALVAKHDNNSTEISPVGYSYNLIQAEELYQRGDNYFYGINDCFEDEGKAIELYKQALNMGLYKASYRLGGIYAGKGQIQKAISTYMLGAENGCFSNYAKLGKIYSSYETSINQRNAELAWAKFFENIHNVIHKELPLDPKELLFFDYLFYTLLRKWDVELSYLVCMSPYKEKIMSVFERATNEEYRESELGKELEFYIKYMIK